MSDTPAPPQKKPKKSFKLQSSFATAWWEAVKSPQLSAKFAALLVVLGTVGAFYVLGIAGKRGIYLWKNRPEALSRAAREQKQLTDFLKQQSEDAKEKVSSVDLGQFTVEVKPPSNADGSTSKNLMNMAEIKISIRCGDRDTREFIETHPILVKNAVTSVFTQLDRDDFLTNEGKISLKHRLLNKLNDWLQEEHVSGKIEDVYFPTLVVN